MTCLQVPQTKAGLLQLQISPGLLTSWGLVTFSRFYMYIPITQISQSDQVTCHSVPDTIYLRCWLQLQCNYIDVCSTVCHKPGW